LLWAEDAETLELRLEFHDAVDLERHDPDLTGCFHIDRGVVEERDPLRHHPQIADDVFEDLSVRFDHTQFVGEVTLLQEGFHAATVERCVELVRVAQTGKPIHIPDPAEKQPGTWIGPAGPVDARIDELVRRKIELQLPDHTVCKLEWCDVAAFELLNGWRPYPSPPNFGAILASRQDPSKLGETGEIDQDTAEIEEQDID